MFILDNSQAKKSLFLKKLTSTRKSLFSAGLFLIAVFLLVLYLGPFGGRLGLFSERKAGQNSLAAGTNESEVENWNLLGSATVKADSTASSGKLVEFGATNTNFQPSAPYYATFVYLWYKNPNTDSSWSYWSDLSNKPPSTWFSHYLPDPNPSAFDPANELYSANNYDNFKWQVSKMAEAKQEVAIASWWGQGTREDVAFNNIINNFMPKADNPYPNLRWSMYYENEGFSDPPVSTIVSDLNYIKTKYAGSPYMLRVNGKPVIFVYAGANDNPGTMTQRWKDANSQVGNYFYINLKVYSGYKTDPNQPDSWHQYAPANRSGSHSPYSYYVSPGFWKDGDAERLVRDPVDFENVVKAMVSSNATWRLTETWNEWGEGTAVEPGEQVVLNSATGKEEPDPAGYPFKNLYIDILNRNLPALEQGTGR